MSLQQSVKKTGQQTSIKEGTLGWIARTMERQPLLGQTKDGLMRYSGGITNFAAKKAGRIYRELDTHHRTQDIKGKWLTEEIWLKGTEAQPTSRLQTTKLELPERVEEAEVKPYVAKQLTIWELHSSIQRIRKDGATEAREQTVIKAGWEAWKRQRIEHTTLAQKRAGKSPGLKEGGGTEKVSVAA